MRIDFVNVPIIGIAEDVQINPDKVEAIYAGKKDGFVNVVIQLTSGATFLSEESLEKVTRRFSPMPIAV